MVDVVGFNDKSWFDQAGHTHSDKLHLTERYTRTDSLTLKLRSDHRRPGRVFGAVDGQQHRRLPPGLQAAGVRCDENAKDSRHMTTETSKK